ncbi:DEAD/DEAH box helicase family protein [Actinomarinicola tropica]|uniref:Helicase n=1 Tax=Actinomarinicola tropica TaxID=2789776 RepID=A0A5Q2RBV6_9ACTN|nr:helicase [Actinomarinicola tropica]QGG94359.1 helicase [Actinomarinicola tropica]
MSSQGFTAEPILRNLTKFQRATVEHIMRRYFDDLEPTRRFLTADETGLGKSHVARGVVASLIERLQTDESVDRIDIVYVCSNADIAEQNLSRLNVTGEDHLPFASRLTLLAKESHRLRAAAQQGLKPVNLVSFTPGTSFDRGQRSGAAEERALLYLILRQELDLDERTARQARVLLRYRKAAKPFEYEIDVLARHIERNGHLDESIVVPFLAAIRNDGLDRRLLRMCDAIGQRRTLAGDEWEPARDLISDLRGALAQASVHCLEPDLVILDEFQRFRHLLDPESGAAAELAHDLFDHADARVLLLSATPYKPFTYAEERLDGDDHQRDFLATLQFLAGGEPAPVDRLRHLFADLRAAAVTGRDPVEITDELRRELLQLMCRTERPTADELDMLDERHVPADQLEPADIVDVAALRALARELDCPFSIEYWKSAPYFVNFSEGYRLGNALRDALAGDETSQPRELAALRHTRRIDRQAVEAGEPFDPGNARLRSLVAETAGDAWWQLLWMPPSLPYLEPSGAYARDDADQLTKRLIFSSWAATPTAIAAILSHHAQRHTTPKDGGIHARLDFRLTPDGRPGAMTSLTLFWPNPALATRCDPLALVAGAGGRPLSAEEVEGRAAAQLDGVPDDGDGHSTTVDAWYWRAPLLLEGATPDMGVDDIVGALSGDAAADPSEEHDADAKDPTRLRRHVEHALHAADVEQPERRPADLRRTVAAIGLHAPANAAYRAIGRQLTEGHSVSPAAHWTAAATIANGFRALFNRPDVALLLDQLHPGLVYWRAVVAYCAAGNLQAVLDEYLHHQTRTITGGSPLSDEPLLRVAGQVRDAIAMRPARYTAFDPDNPATPIPLMSRFALRYGNRRQTEGDVRQPQVRNAFNSPFWPFVLASTSVGQEGIDFHWWCHSVLHWNTPSSPVDFDQREGRVHRYAGHAIRKNIAARHRASMLAPGVRDPWDVGFAAAVEHRDQLGDLTPHWVYPGPAKVQRITAPYPLSIDHDRLQRLKDDVALYRLTLGQPRQEDLLGLLRRQGIAGSDDTAARLRLDLSPPTPDR